MAIEHPFWKVSGLGGESLYIRPSTLVGDRDLDVLPAVFALSYLDQWLSDPVERQTLMDLYATLFGSLSLTAYAADEAARVARSMLATAFERGELVVLIEREQTRAVTPIQPPVDPVPPPRPRPTNDALSFYELLVLDELEAPLGGVEIVMRTPLGTEQVLTDASGRARVVSAPPGFGDARVSRAAQLAEVMAGRERGPRRVTPLPEDESLHIATPSQLGAAIVLPDGEPQRLMIITRTDVLHTANPNPWSALTLIEADAGPWLLEQAEETALRLHSNALGRTVRLLGPAPEAMAIVSPVIAPPPVAEDLWIAPDVYVVQPGDTMVRIAQRYLGDGARWPEIWALNRDRFAGRSPDVIFPGDRFVMPAAAVPSWVALPVSQPPDATVPPQQPPALPPEWLVTGVDALHEALFNGAFGRALDLLATIPLDPPPPPAEGPSSTFLEELLYRKAMFELALGGIVETPAAPREEVV